MNEKTTKLILDHLRKIDQSSAAIAALINESSGDFPESRLPWLKESKCLECGEKIETTEKSIRGCHERCYRRIKRRIEDGLITEHSAVSSGHLYYAEPTGRPQTKSAIDSVIQAEITATMQLEKKNASKRSSSTTKNQEKRKS